MRRIATEAPGIGRGDRSFRPGDRDSRFDNRVPAPRVRRPGSERVQQADAADLRAQRATGDRWYSRSGWLRNAAAANAKKRIRITAEIDIRQLHRLEPRPGPTGGQPAL